MKDNTKEKIYKQNNGIIKTKGEGMPKVLISTIYSVIDPIMSIATKIGVDRVIVLIDNKPNDKQSKSLELLKQAIGKVVEVRTIKTELYDIVKVSEDVVKAIDVLGEKDQIFINITASKRTQALGLLYASYCRIKKISKIFYVTDKNKLITLPKLDYNLNNSQKLVLDYVDKYEIKNHSEFAEKIKLSRGMLYRNISELQDLGLIEVDEGFKLTDAGRIVRL